MGHRRDEPKDKLADKAREISQRLKDQGMSSQVKEAAWLNMPAEDLARMLKSLDPRMLQYYANQMGIDFPIEMLRNVDSETVDKIRGIVRNSI